MAWKAAACLFPPTPYKRYRPRPSDFHSAFERYLEPSPKRPTDDLYTTAVQKVSEWLNLPKIKPLHLNDSMARFPHPEKSPGLPYTREGIRKKADVPPSRVRSFVHQLKYGLITNIRTPCTAAARTTVATVDKFRLIWVYPCNVTMAEGMFAQPLIEAFLSWRTPYALWVQYGKGHMKWLASQRRSRRQKWISLDWSNFDANVPAWLIRDAFGILYAKFDLSAYEGWGRPTDDHTLPRLWKRLVHYFINTPMKFPGGEVRVKAKGVPSGSYFTNIIDTVCNAIACLYILMKMGLQSHQVTPWFLGDDALMLVPGLVDLQAFAQYATDVFGFKLNAAKSSVGDTFSFLGYGSTPSGVPIADYNKLLAQLLLPDAPDRSLDDFVIRARALQLSCFGVGCPEFVKLVDDTLQDFPAGSGTLHPRDELVYKMHQLGLSDWPPLTLVWCLVG
ncbi:MAG: RNA-dependent RNA polymerase [Hangzhou partitivirus 1]|nr:MAG: RNA-dependent RNA polymerase [Hangzhou partitivirus 1]